MTDAMSRAQTSKLVPALRPQSFRRGKPRVVDERQCQVYKRNLANKYRLKVSRPSFLGRSRAAGPFPLPAFFSSFFSSVGPHTSALCASPLPAFFSFSALSL